MSSIYGAVSQIIDSTDNNRITYKDVGGAVGDSNGFIWDNDKKSRTLVVLGGTTWSLQQDSHGGTGPVVSLSVGDSATLQHLSVRRFTRTDVTDPITFRVSTISGDSV